MSLTTPTKPLRRGVLQIDKTNPRSSPVAQNGRRLIYGGLPDAGVGIELHEFEALQDFSWSNHFHAKTGEICLNLAGKGTIHHGGSTMEFEPLTAGFYAPGKGALQALRQGGQQHLFITITFTFAFLRQLLAPCDGALHPLAQEFLQSRGRWSGTANVCRLTSEQERLAAQLRQPPPVFQGARELWYRGKVLELLSHFFFAQAQQEDELFCDRQKRVARERVERVVAILRRDLANPPDLLQLGREVGCSSFYLSRTFSSEMACTIPQFLRKIRMEKAAELLKSGKYNVTEAALEVGYSSLSHFSQAFCQIMGCCPGLFPLQTPTQSACARSENEG